MVFGVLRIAKPLMYFKIKALLAMKKPFGTTPFLAIKVALALM
jgi:hypothetical protein